MNVHLTKEAQDRVQKIAAKNGGRITPDDVIADAKKKASPLHKLFQWDVNKAARQHWLETARSIIRQVRVEVTTESKTVNVVAYVRDPQRHETGKQGYVALQQAAISPQDSASVMAYELGRAEDSLRRVLGIADALGMVEQAKEALSKVVGMRQQVDAKRGRRTVGVGVPDRVAA